MVFNSPVFLVFLAVSLLVYYLLPKPARRLFLLAASYVFYMWAIPAYGLVVLAETVFGYFLARALGGAPQGRRRHVLSILGVAVPLAALLFFKYSSWIVADLWALFGAAVPAIGWAVPLGISFFTLQLIGYLLDVSSGAVSPEKDFVAFALYISFFPQILSGPIGRSRELLGQFRQAPDFSYTDLATGFQRFLTGLFRKVVLADGLAVIVNGIYGNLADYRGLPLLLAVLLYALQLYCDFSGYTDMAVGAARMFGISLRENFAAPYFAVNISGFWKRWHMSLTTWFNDYLFTPLVWSRWADKLLFGKKWEEHKPHFALNLLLVFLVSGLWHGAAWTFLLWGLLNGLYRVGEEGLHKLLPPNKKKPQGRAKVFAKQLGVYLLFALSLVFFRAGSVADALYVFRNLFVRCPLSVASQQLWHLSCNGIATNAGYLVIFWGLLLLSLALVWHFDSRIHRSVLQKSRQPQYNPVGTYRRPVRWIFYWFMGLTSMLFYFIAQTSQSGSASFIYLGF